MYITGCDYLETADYLSAAWRVNEIAGSLNEKRILDAMCGPGGLGRELLLLGAKHVVFHDGDPIMVNHAVKKAFEVRGPEQQVQSLFLPVDQIRSASSFDLVVCQNSLHQLASTERLKKVMERFVYVTEPGGFVIIFDYQRGASPEFLAALEERLKFTKQEIVPLLVPTFQAAFSREEFEGVLRLMSGIRWSVNDAKLLVLTPEMRARVDQDPVKGHVLDRSPISLEVFIQKETI